jgi:hypothetical protein
VVWSEIGRVEMSEDEEKRREKKRKVSGKRAKRVEDRQSAIFEHFSGRFREKGTKLHSRMLWNYTHGVRATE